MPPPMTNVMEPQVQNPNTSIPRPPMLTNPNLNPNNRRFQPTYATEVANYPSYSLDTIEINQLNLCFEKIITQPTNEPEEQSYNLFLPQNIVC